MVEKPTISIQKLHVENFGCIRDASVELEPLTVLVGPNDSGKSTLLHALAKTATASMANEGWGRPFPTPGALNAQTFNRKGGTIKIGLQGAISDNVYSYDMEVGTGTVGVGLVSEHLAVGSADAKRTDQGVIFRASELASEEGPFHWISISMPMLSPRWLVSEPGNSAEFKRFKEIFLPATNLLLLLDGASIYSLRPEDLRLASPQPIASSAEEVKPRLEMNGRGLANAFADLLLRGRDTLERIEHALIQAMPQVKRIDVNQRRRALAPNL